MYINGCDCVCEFKYVLVAGSSDCQHVCQHACDFNVCVRMLRTHQELFTSLMGNTRIPSSFYFDHWKVYIVATSLFVICSQLMSLFMSPFSFGHFSTFFFFKTQKK